MTVFSAIAKLFSANLFVQIIPFLSSPVFAYLYDLSVFGMFATVVSLSSLMGCFASGKLERAVIIAHSDNAASVIASSAYVLIFMFTLVVGLILLLLSFFLTLETFYYAIPFFLIVSSFYQVAMAYANQRKQYNLMIKSRLLGAIIRNTLMLSFGYFDPSVYSLLFGYFIGILLELTAILKLRAVIALTKRRFFWCMLRYNKFLKFTTFSSFLENFTSAGLPALFNFAFGEREAGAIAMAQRLLAKPVGALSGAVSEVFKVAFEKDCFSDIEKKKFYRKILITLLFGGLLPFLIALIYVEQVVLIVVGENWELAAKYAEVLLPVYFLSFVIGSVSSILFAFDYLVSELFIQILVVLGVLVVLIILPTYSVAQNATMEMFAAVMLGKYFAILFIVEVAFKKKLKG